MTPSRAAITVMVPTRGRVDCLELMLATLYGKAADPGRVQVVARIDNDDAATAAYLHGVRPYVKVVRKPRVGYAKNAQMVNECAAVATGDLLLVANDDLVFETEGWDAGLVTAAARFPDGIFDLGVDTVLNNENYCFPCVGRATVAALGAFFDERLLYPDIWLRDVMAPFGRAVRVPEVVIRHAWRGMTEDQATALASAHGPAHEELYARCVDEGRAKIAKVLGTVGAS